MSEREILRKGDVARAQRALATLWEALAKPLAVEPHSWMTHEWARAAFGDGICGPAIAVGHRALATDDEALADTSRALLLDAIEAGRSLWIAPGFAQGYGGLGFAVEHMVAIGLVEDVGEITDAIAKRVCEAIAPGGLTFDHFFGTAGLAVYGHERALASSATDVLDAALVALVDRMEFDGDGAVWTKIADTRWMDPALASRYPEGHVDTSMSHGMAGVVAALAVAAPTRPPLLPVIRKVLQWLWRHTATAGERLWPNIIGETSGGSGWCRGDLGVATAACAAAHAIADADWIERTTAAVRTSLARRDWKVEAVSLCHGPAGAMHIAQRMFALTGDGAFADVARVACAEVLDHVTARDPATLGPGLFNGISGVALALHALLEPVEPTWDRWFVPGLPTAR